MTTSSIETDIQTAVTDVENFFTNTFNTPATTVGKVVSAFETTLDAVDAVMPTGIPAKVTAVMAAIEAFYTAYKIDLLPAWDKIKLAVQAAVQAILEALEAANTPTSTPTSTSG